MVKITLMLNTTNKEIDMNGEKDNIDEEMKEYL
jgi:hypothetical protein